MTSQCGRGHPYSGDNLYVWNGRRYCRACRAEYATTHLRVSTYRRVAVRQKTGPKPQPIGDRLLRRSERMPNGCLVWNGAVGSSGYGQTHTSEPRTTALVHRLAYEAWVGPIPDGLQIDHLCRNRRCIEPTHLEPVTAVENVRRSDSPAGVAIRRPSCKAGHPWTETNTYRTKKGSRACRVCHRDYMRARYQPRKAA